MRISSNLCLGFVVGYVVSSYTRQTTECWALGKDRVRHPRLVGRLQERGLIILLSHASVNGTDVVNANVGDRTSRIVP